GVCHGFIGNRMYQCYQREAGLLLLEGASPTQVDKALYEFGLPMGPFALADLTGIDIGYMMRKSLTPDQFEARAFRVHDRLVEMGRKGQKTGAGFYTYEAGSRTPKDDGVAMDIIRGVVVEEDMDQRAIPDDEIIERCIYAMVNEGARILEEGIAYRASDIDVIYANGYGFPRFRGGPMFYAQLTGLDHVLEAVRGFAGRFGPRWWQPPELFVRAAGKGRWSE
ncbi:MAG: 3-hydroxyacyl-CoA dehydrogenase family protein, partial [Rhodospirillales bacterium]|nr:3-hydroxyacyl-CoA dehydrogenase family protein [Rhodospirillales bacterium]